MAQISSFGRRLRALRLAKGLSQVELANLIGRHQTTIGPYERDEYSPSRDIVERLASVLQTSPEFLFFGRSPQHRAIPVVGRLGPAAQLQSIDLLGVSLREEQIIGLRVEDDTMLPTYRPGCIVLAQTLSALDATTLIGRDVLAGLPDGRVFLRRLMPNANAETFDLVASNGPTMAGVTLGSVQLVVGTLAPEALVAPEPEANGRNPYG